MTNQTTPTARSGSGSSANLDKSELNRLRHMLAEQNRELEDATSVLRENPDIGFGIDAAVMSELEDAFEAADTERAPCVPGLVRC
jgi:hypothetical protein